MFSLFRKKERPALIPFDFDNNRFPAHTKWPPVFADMTSKEQFRLERKFRRRSKLKWARPVWNRNLQLLQWGCSIFIVTYCTFAVDWSGTRDRDLDTSAGDLKHLRDWVDGVADSLWTHTSSKESRQHVALMQEKLKSDSDSTRT